MTKLIIRIYDYLHAHRTVALLSALAVVAVMAASLLSMTYKEDISDFLPLNSNHQDALKIYQNISGADRLFALVSSTGKGDDAKDSIAAAVTTFADLVTERDTAHMVRDLTTGVDMEKAEEMTSMVYENIPYFLTDRDYERFDSLLSRPGYVAAQLAQDKQMLMFPVGGMLSDNLQRDPLNLFTPAVSRMRQGSGDINYEIYDGCIFSPDMQRAIVMMKSPFGSSETENNSRLLSLLKKAAGDTEKAHAGIRVSITGGPAIAVGNASQIKQDSILSVAISVVLILLLLITSLRSLRNMMLIVLSIAFGWLFAMGGLGLIHSNVSIIVIGISSVIIGIAVNYPLHLATHLRHTPDIRVTLREIAAPLVVGNITTVGAFLALVPLDSVALRDLGIFSSLLLIGTIVFALVYLPHLIKISKPATECAAEKKRRRGLISFLASLPLDSNRRVVAVICVVTVVLAFFSFRTTFDSDISNINYMSEEQKQDMEYLKTMLPQAAKTERLYLVSQDTTLDRALSEGEKVQPLIDSMVRKGLVKAHTGCTDFLPSQAEQRRRLARWEAFKQRYAALLTTGLAAEAQKAGFAEGSFDDFNKVLQTDFRPQGQAFFTPIAEGAFSSNLSIDRQTKDYAVVDLLDVAPERAGSVRQMIDKQASTQFVFDVKGMNNAIADNLSDNFNYIGWVCGFIVFFFLWLSFGSLELALISFIPMAVSWVWILGLMGLLGIKFNIVNIILATFIFGQGDDYTIFMTEGAMYEYAYRRKMLSSYKHSIILSALIMFIGIGSLIIARHPALRSLAEVTVIGMFVVVLMACVFPPLIYKWLVSSGGRYRNRPISIVPMARMWLCAAIYFSQLTYIYATGFLTLDLLKATQKRKERFHRLVMRLYLWDLRHIPGVRFNILNNAPETFAKPRMVVANHQSMLDSALLMALTPKIIIIANRNVSSNRVISRVFRWLDFYTIIDFREIDYDVLRRRVNEGYSILMFPEGRRNTVSSILRFHKGAFKIATDLGLDILPVIIHGANDVLPRNSVQVFRGTITVTVEPEIRLKDCPQDFSQLTKEVNARFRERYAEISSRLEKAAYFKDFVLDRYRYKGTEVFAQVRKNIKSTGCFASTVDRSYNESVINLHLSDHGEQALFMALVHRDKQVRAALDDADARDIALHCGEGIDNLTFVND